MASGRNKSKIYMKKDSDSIGRNTIKPPAGVNCANILRMSQELHQELVWTLDNSLPDPEVQLTREAIMLATHVLSFEVWATEPDMVAMCLALASKHKANIPKRDKWISMVFSWWNSEITGPILEGLGT